jgi:Dolichyl-phosphate-mannose-protein mannosyltransferase
MSLLKFTILNPGENISTPASLSKSQVEYALEKMNTRIFFMCLFLFQLVLIFQGIDLSDEGFLATFYQQIFKNPESVQYNFMFWLTGIIGGVYYKLFPVFGLWGLRLGGVMVTTSTAILVYSLLKKYLNPNYLKLGLFLIIITLNNDIKELNYNNLSALFYVTIIYFLFRGLKENSNLKIFVSGIFISLNFFIRPPNILEVGMVIGIIYYGYTKKRNFRFITKQILAFLAGFLICTAVTLLIIYSIGHWDVYINALKELYKMGKASPQTEVEKGDYGIFRLLKQLKSNNAKSIFISLSIIGGLGLGISAYSILKKKITDFYKIGILLKSVFILTVVILICSGIIDHWFILYFYSGLIVMVFLLVLTTEIDFDIKFLLFCGCFILISFPFGSSAGIMTAGRYSFWIGLPISINFLFNIKSVKNQFVFFSGELKNSFQLNITERQMRIAKNLLLGLLIFEGLFHSYFYPFFDWRNRAEMHYSLDNKLLAGIYTTKGRAEAINELLHESSKYVKKGDYVLAYDCMPLYNFLTESVPYIRSAYPWLYETEIFKNELDLAKIREKILPVVIMQTIQTIGDGSKWPEQTLQTDYSKWDVNQGRNKFMNEFLKDNNYKEVWTNGFFRILIPNQNKN